MTYKPAPTLTSGVGEPRVWSVDTETKEALARVIEALERIQYQLELVTGTHMGPGDGL